jgi:hypothetical protein
MNRLADYANTCFDGKLAAAPAPMLATWSPQAVREASRQLR